jgi:hypothetical protein
MRVGGAAVATRHGSHDDKHHSSGGECWRVIILVASIAGVSNSSNSCYVLVFSV